MEVKWPIAVSKIKMDAAMNSRMKLRISAAALTLVAIVIFVSVMRQAMQSDDGGPPMGAICSALPSIAALIGAGICWQDSNKNK